MMPDELRLHLTPIPTFTGRTTIVARVLTVGGVQVGSDVALSEDAGDQARYAGDFPAAAAGEYDVAFLDTDDADTVFGVSTVFWDGAAEVDELTFRAGLTTARAALLDNLDVAVSTRSSHAAPDLSNLDVAVSTRLASASYIAPLTAAEVNAECDQAIADAALATSAALSATEATLVAEHDATQLAVAGVPAAPGAATVAAAVRTELTVELGRMDAAVSTRSDHPAPDLSNLDVAVSTRLASSSYTTPLTAVQVRAEVDAAVAGIEEVAVRVSAVEVTSTSLAVLAWLEQGGAFVSGGLVSATATLRTHAGVAVAPAVTLGLSPAGTFSGVITYPAELDDRSNYNLHVSIVSALGTTPAIQAVPTYT